MLLARGEMAEWFMAAVLKTVERKLRGFESLSLRQAVATGRRADSEQDALLRDRG